MFGDAIGFEWDEHNRDKNLVAHGVTSEECEEALFDPHKKIVADAIQAGHEARFILIGCTNADRVLFIVFTLRKNKLRVISARDLNKRERKLYEKTA